MDIYIDCKYSRREGKIKMRIAKEGESYLVCLVKLTLTTIWKRKGFVV